MEEPVKKTAYEILYEMFLVDEYDNITGRIEEIIEAMEKYKDQFIKP